MVRSPEKLIVVIIEGLEVVVVVVAKVKVVMVVEDL